MALVLDRVGRSYEGVRGAPPVDVLADISLEVPQGDRIAILGRSGSGKTTLLAILGLLDRPTSGSYMVGDEDAGRCSPAELARLRSETFGFVFQQFCLLPELTAAENVEAALIHAKASPRGRSARILAALDAVGLAGLAKRRTSLLSGGEKQRVAIARAVVSRPRVILADEPTGSLDETTGQQVMAQMHELARSVDATFVCVTHDPEVAAGFPRVIEVRTGRLHERATS